MIKAFRISCDLKNTYRVNGIIYSIQQIPVIKRLFTDELYASRGLKIFAGILSAAWEIVSAFLGKYLYLLLLVALPAGLYKGGDAGSVSMHILLFLTLIGTFMNTYMFDPSNDKYYAMILMRMDARAYTLSNYLYTSVKTVVGFLPFTIYFGMKWGTAPALYILLPFFIMGAKMTAAWLLLSRYERKGICMNENLPPKFAWPLTGILLVLAYGLPYIGITVPAAVISAAAALSLAAGLYCLTKIMKFGRYREMYQLILADKRNAVEVGEIIHKTTEEQSRKMISQDTAITSRKKGFEYFNELFIRRHKRALWRPAGRTACIAAFIIAALLVVMQVNMEVKLAVNRLLLVFLPYFVFIMYAINRGTSFTQVLFMNCDHSMLTFAFYKKPEFILRLFCIRLREIIKVNLLPAAVIGTGFALMLYVSGGTDNALNYIVLFVSILALSVFFSVHYLTCYYLLQPYNVNTELKSATYRIVMSGTYIVCFLFMKLRMDTFVFGIVTTVFCILYSIIASLLVYRFAPRTFRLRN